MSNKGNKRMYIYRYTVIFEPAEEGGYVVHVPALNGLATQGESIEEAREMARDAIEGHIESLVAHGDPVPIESAEQYTKPTYEVMEVSVA